MGDPLLGFHPALEMPGASPGLGCGYGPAPPCCNTSPTLGLRSCTQRDKPNQLPPSPNCPHQPQEELLLRPPTHPFILLTSTNKKHSQERFGPVFLQTNSSFASRWIYTPSKLCPQGLGPLQRAPHVPGRQGSGRALRHAASRWRPAAALPG